MMKHGTMVVRGLSLAVALAACGEDEPAPVEIERAFEVEPKIVLVSGRGAVSATGSVREDTLTLTASHRGSASLKVGRDCESGIGLRDNIALAANTPQQLTVTATGPLAGEGLYTIQACFTDERGFKARSAIGMEVDNTAPVIQSNAPAGEYCGPVYFDLFCSDCFVLGYSMTGEVTISADGTVTSGTAYRGERLFVGVDTTVRWKGIDAAGNETSGTAVLDISAGPMVTNVAVASRYLSANGRTSTNLSFDTVSGLNYSVRDDATTCDNGFVIASGTTVSGTNSVSVDAVDVDSGDNNVLVCVRAPAGCPAGRDVLVTRKDFSLGWTITPAPSGPRSPLAFHTMVPLDASLFFASPTYTADHLVDGVAIATREIFQTAALSDPDPMDRQLYMVDQDFVLPENADGQVSVAFTGITDEAGNDVPDSFINVTYSNLNEATPINKGSFATSDAVVIGPTAAVHWLRCPVGQVYDTGSSSCTGTATTHTWTQAINACAALNVAPFNSRTGWRLPYLSELAAIVDPDASAAPFSDVAFTLPTETRFWSNTGHDSNNAYAMNFTQAAAARTSKATALSVRCVSGTSRTSRNGVARAAWDSGSSTYVSNANGPVVVEPATQLAWDQAPSASNVTAATAATTCTGTRNGSTGWRLPTAAHFTSIMALRTNTNGFLSGVTFTGGTGCYWVHSVAGAANPTQCYTPNTGALGAGTSQPVWCVREQP